MSEFPINPVPAKQLFQLFVQNVEQLGAAFQGTLLRREEAENTQEMYHFDRAGEGFGSPVDEKKESFRFDRFHVEIVCRSAWWNESEIANASCRVFIKTPEGPLLWINGFSENGSDVVDHFTFTHESDESLKKFRAFWDRISENPGK